jgi:hypothetical protein
MTELRVASLSLLLLLSSGCDAPAMPMPVDAGSDAFAPPPDAYVAPDAWVEPFVIAEHGAGTVVPDLGGARMTHPQLVVITYADDPNRATLEANAAWLVTSAWLTTVGAEYGIGAGSILANVERTDAAPDAITGAEIEALLAAGIADHTLPTPPDGSFDEVLYLLYFPRHTTITDDSLGMSCVTYGGYHYEVDNGGHPFAYAVIPSCDSFQPSLTSLEFEEATVSHEVVEAATDRLPQSDPAWEFPRSSFSFSPWLFIGPELGDLCAVRVGADASVREGGFVATRIWSNAAASSNDRDPCIPADPTVPYYAVSISPAAAVGVAAGASTTFALDAWSTAPVDDFRLYAAPSGGTFTPEIALDLTTVNNGDHATLTVSVPVGTPSDAYAIVYVETVRSADEYSGTPVVVYVR